MVSGSTDDDEDALVQINNMGNVEIENLNRRPPQCLQILAREKIVEMENRSKVPTKKMSVANSKIKINKSLKKLTA